MFDYPFSDYHNYHSSFYNRSSSRRPFTYPYERETRRKDDMRNELLTRQVGLRTNNDPCSCPRCTIRRKSPMYQEPMEVYHGTTDEKPSRTKISQDKTNRASDDLWDIETSERKTSKTRNSKKGKQHRAKSHKKKKEIPINYREAQDSMNFSSLSSFDNIVRVENASDSEDDFAYSKSLRPSPGSWMEPNYDYIC